MKPKREIKALPYLKTVETFNVDAMTEDGVLYTVEKRTQVVVEDDKGFMLMFNYMHGLINGLDSIVDVKVMNWISENINYNDNVITLNKYWKEKIKEYAGYSISAIDRSIGVLVIKGFLVKDETCKRCAIYNVHPSYVWHGDREKRDGKLKWTLELEQYNNLPDSERQKQDDIQRFVEYYKKQRFNDK